MWLSKVTLRYSQSGNCSIANGSSRDNVTKYPRYSPLMPYQQILDNVLILLYFYFYHSAINRHNYSTTIFIKVKVAVPYQCKHCSQSRCIRVNPQVYCISYKPGWLLTFLSFCQTHGYLSNCTASSPFG